MMVRAPSVAGHFYPGDAVHIKDQLLPWLDGNITPVDDIRAIIAPHAGHQYSGQTAALAWRQVKHSPQKFSRVLMIGPSHHFNFDGIALPGSFEFATPLGDVMIDQGVISELNDHSEVHISDAVHAQEHCLEVQLPFLQLCLDNIKLIPILTGNILPERLAQLLAPYWSNETLLVVSSDLSHFHPYQEAIAIDHTTCEKIENKQADLTSSQACGCTGINTLLHMISRPVYSIEKLGYTNSGDTGGDKQRVVGYASYLIRADF